MKELRFFFHPTPADGLLPQEEAQHALRVLRLGVGDEIYLVDGRGAFHRGVIRVATNHRCEYDIAETLPQQPEWQGSIHVAVAPTKNMDRMEWLAEKATEIGVDAISLFDCQWSERRVVKTERLQKIIVAAMKQSRKAWLPRLDEVEDFRRFVARDGLPRQRFIAHCHDDGAQKPFLADVLETRADAIVLIGPEGDFSPAEVETAVQHGFRPVSLGTSRLRTETAALAAVHLMRIANRTA